VPVRVLDLDEALRDQLGDLAARFANADAVKRMVSYL